MIFKSSDINKYNLQSDLQLIEDFLDVSDIQLAKNCDVSIEDIHNYITGQVTTAPKEHLDAIYNYAFTNNLYLNEIKWQMYQEEYTTSNTKVLCHGSRNYITGNLRLDVNGPDNDFANGFYCGETLRQAGMFVSEEPNSCLYFLTANMTDLKICHIPLTASWLFGVSYYRDILGEYSNCKEAKQIIEQCEAADVIIAPIADNRLYELFDSFANNEITDKQCIHAMALTHLGNQYVFKTQKALNNIILLERSYLCPAEKAFYNRMNVRESNTGLSKAELAKKLYKNEGKYIRAYDSK